MFKVKWPSKEETKLSENTALIAIVLGGVVGIAATVMYLVGN